MVGGGGQHPGLRLPMHATRSILRSPSSHQRVLITYLHL